MPINKLNMPRRVEEIPTGWTNKVIKIKTEGGDYAFRFPRSEFWAKTLIDEYKNTKYVGKFIKTVKQKLNFYDKTPYSIHKYIDGEPLSAVFPEMTEEQKQNAAEKIVSYLKKLQKIPFVAGQFEHLSNFLTRLAISTGNKNYDYTTLNELKIQEKKTLVVVHGDFNADNIIIANGELAMVIDYAFCGVSSPLADIARICGRLPDFAGYFSKYYDINKLKPLIDMWKYVDANYINFCLK